MRSTIIAIVLFLFVVLSTSTPATAQMPEKPVVVMIPEESASGIKIHAVVTSGCTGKLVLSVTGIPGAPDLDLSNMRYGQSRTIMTGKYLYPGEHLLSWIVNQSLGTGDCPFATSGRLYPTKFIVGSGQFSENEPHVPTRQDGKPHSLVFDESGSNPLLRVVMVLPKQTQIYALQIFPNGTTSIEDVVHLGNPAGFSFGAIAVPRGRMTNQMPIIFWAASANGNATTGFIHRP